jgi:hypothetical protein
MLRNRAATASIIGSAAATAPTASPADFAHPAKTAKSAQ